MAPVNFLTIFFYLLTHMILFECNSQQGVLGIKVKIMLEWDPKGKQGPPTPLPDLVTIHPPKEEEILAQPPVLTTDIEVPVQVPVA